MSSCWFSRIISTASVAEIIDIFNNERTEDYYAYIKCAKLSLIFDRKDIFEYILHKINTHPDTVEADYFGIIIKSIEYERLEEFKLILQALEINKDLVAIILNNAIFHNSEEIFNYIVSNENEPHKFVPEISLQDIISDREPRKFYSSDSKKLQLLFDLGMKILSDKIRLTKETAEYIDIDYCVELFVSVEKFLRQDIIMYIEFINCVIGACHPAAKESRLQWVVIGLIIKNDKSTLLRLLHYKKRDMEVLLYMIIYGGRYGSMTILNEALILLDGFIPPGEVKEMKPFIGTSADTFILSRDFINSPEAVKSVMKYTLASQAGYYLCGKFIDFNSFPLFWRRLQERTYDDKLSDVLFIFT